MGWGVGEGRCGVSAELFAVSPQAGSETGAFLKLDAEGVKHIVFTHLLFQLLSWLPLVLFPG